jgi:cysteinyl-tRNA synthetase
MSAIELFDAEAGERRAPPWLQPGGAFSLRVGTEPRAHAVGEVLAGFLAPLGVEVEPTGAGPEEPFLTLTVADDALPLAGGLVEGAAPEDADEEVVQLAYLLAHYRAPLALAEALEEAEARLAYAYETLASAQLKLDELGWPSGVEGEVRPAVEALLPTALEALSHDLDTPAALGALTEALKEVNRLVQSGKGIPPKVRARTLARALRDVEALGEVLGCFTTPAQEAVTARRDRLAEARGIDGAQVDALVAARVAARAAGDFERADALRVELEALGVALHDGAGGSRWTL